MALKLGTGTSHRFTYGSQSVFEFTVRFASSSMSSDTPLNTQHYLPPTNLPTAGTITVAGVTVTLAANEVNTPAAVAKAIKAASIANYAVSVDTYDPCKVRLTDTRLGPQTRPTVVLGTAENIFFINETYTQGALCTSGAQDDIYIGGGAPVTLTFSITSASGSTVSTSTGTLHDQESGTLSYGSSLSFTNGVCVLTAPVTFVRVTTAGVSAGSQVKLWITR